MGRPSLTEAQVAEMELETIGGQNVKLLQVGGRLQSEARNAVTKATDEKHCANIDLNDVQIQWGGGNLKPLCLTADWNDMMGSGGGFLIMKQCADDKVAVASASSLQRWTHSVNSTIVTSDMARNPFNGDPSTPDTYGPLYSMQIVQHSWYYQQAGQMYLTT